MNKIDKDKLLTAIVEEIIGFAVDLGGKTQDVVLDLFKEFFRYRPDLLGEYKYILLEEDPDYSRSLLDVIDKHVDNQSKLKIASSS